MTKIIGYIIVNMILLGFMIGYVSYKKEVCSFYIKQIDSKEEQINKLSQKLKECKKQL